MNRNFMKILPFVAMLGACGGMSGGLNWKDSVSGERVGVYAGVRRFTGRVMLSGIPMRGVKVALYCQRAQDTRSPWRQVLTDDQGRYSLDRCPEASSVPLVVAFRPGAVPYRSDVDPSFSPENGVISLRPVSTLWDSWTAYLYSWFFPELSETPPAPPTLGASSLCAVSACGHTWTGMSSARFTDTVRAVDSAGCSYDYSHVRYVGNNVSILRRCGSESSWLTMSSADDRSAVIVMLAARMVLSREFLGLESRKGSDTAGCHLTSLSPVMLRYLTTPVKLNHRWTRFLETRFAAGLGARPVKGGIPPLVLAMDGIIAAASGMKPPPCPKGKACAPFMAGMKFYQKFPFDFR